jgi:hypothetical protein
VLLAAADHQHAWPVLIGESFFHVPLEPATPVGATSQDQSRAPETAPSTLMAVEDS